MNTLIEIEGLAKLHGATTVFSDVSFTLAKGDRLAVLGASGGGKTTLVRLLAGPGHRLLLPASALLGAALLLGADLAARTVALPAELPVGVLTAALGAPVFFSLLRRGRRGRIF